MIKLYRYAAGTLLAVSLCLTASAQSDSTYFDLGRTKLRKDLTQHVTIKGEDLERMAFTNLSDAINTWLFGAFPINYRLVYIIDGTLIQDVNIYSIHDIEEVTLLQDATGYVNGGVGKEQVILIKTRRNAGNPNGTILSAQSGIISKTIYDYYGVKDEQRSGIVKGYHQLTLSTRQQINNNRVGLSVNFLKDAVPDYNVGEKPWPAFDLQSRDKHQPSFSLNRIIVNSFIEMPLRENKQLFISANVASQESTYEGIFTRYYFTTDPKIIQTLPSFEEYKLNTTLFNTELRLNSVHKEKYKNTLNINSQLALIRQPDNSIFASTDGSDVVFSTPLFLSIRDHFTFSRQMGHWHMEPAITTSVQLAPDPWGNTAGLLGVTPSLAMYYKDAVQIQTGLHSSLAGLGAYSGFGPWFNLPFATATADVLRLLNTQKAYTWKIYGSFGSATPAESPNIFTLPDLSRSLTSPERGEYLYRNGLRRQYSTQAGSSVHLLDNTLSFNYNYNLRYFSAVGDNTYDVNNIFKYFHTIHRLGVDYKLNKHKDFQWFTQLNASVITSIRNVNPKDAPASETPWSLGWANRLSYKSCVAGVDFNAFFNNHQYAYTGFESLKANSHQYLFQHVYAGYQLTTKGNYPLEFHIFSRNPFYSSIVSSQPQRYNGIGFKLGL